MELKIAQWKAAAETADAFDMAREPCTRDIHAMMCAGSAVPLDEVERYPDGRVFDEAREQVRERLADCRDFLNLANPDMIRELGEVASEAALARPRGDSEYPFLLIPGRMQNSTNTAWRVPGVQRWGYNPAFLHPGDLAELGLMPGDAVEIASRHGRVAAFVQPDEGLRQGVVAMMHGYGGTSGKAYDPRRDGANVNVLTAWHDDPDPHTGMPRMGALPVAIRPA